MITIEFFFFSRIFYRVKFGIKKKRVENESTTKGKTNTNRDKKKISAFPVLYQFLLLLLLSTCRLT